MTTAIRSGATDLGLIVNGVERATLASTGLSIPAATAADHAVNLGQLAGSVIQVVNATYSTQTASSSSVFSDTGLTATITPRYANSTILVTVHQNGCGKDTNNTSLLLRLLRGATTLVDFERFGGGTSSTATNFFGGCGVTYEDSPATTNPTTYKTQMASLNNNATVYTQVLSGSATSSSITLMEIKH